MSSLAPTIFSLPAMKTTASHGLLAVVLFGNYLSPVDAAAENSEECMFCMRSTAKPADDCKEDHLELEQIVRVCSDGHIICKDCLPNWLPNAKKKNNHFVCPYTNVGTVDGQFGAEKCKRPVTKDRIPGEFHKAFDDGQKSEQVRDERYDLTQQARESLMEGDNDTERERLFRVVYDLEDTRLRDEILRDYDQEQAQQQGEAQLELLNDIVLRYIQRGLFNGNTGIARRLQEELQRAQEAKDFRRGLHESLATQAAERAARQRYQRTQTTGSRRSKKYRFPNRWDDEQFLETNLANFHAWVVSQDPPKPELLQKTNNLRDELQKVSAVLVLEDGDWGDEAETGGWGEAENGECGEAEIDGWGDAEKDAETDEWGEDDTRGWDEPDPKAREKVVSQILALFKEHAKPSRKNSSQPSNVGTDI